MSNWILDEQLFRTYREKGYLYIDKSLMIREVLKSHCPALLLQRPSRFGKTLNMTMLYSFFDMNQNSRALFEGLAITEDAEAMSHLNAHPTVYLNLRSLCFPTWERNLEELGRQIAHILERNRPLWDLKKLEPYRRQRIEAYCQQKDLAMELADSLRFITQVLHEATGKYVIVLIDDYDAPSHANLEEAYYSDVNCFFTCFLGEALKSNEHLDRGVLTGIWRLTKESIYGGFNNLVSENILDRSYSTYFGFTESEVEHLLVTTQSPHTMAELNDCCGGYRFAEERIYHPASVMSLLKPEDSPYPSDPKSAIQNLMGDLIQRGRACSFADLSTLLAGDVIQREVNKLCTSQDQQKSGWTLLLFSGYLAAKTYDPRESLADLCIPNQEMRRFFEATVKQGLGLEDCADSLGTHLLSGALNRFAHKLRELVSVSLDHDRIAYPEDVFHMLGIALQVGLLNDYQVLMSGKGRYEKKDLQLIPKKPGHPGFLFEFKTAGSAKAEALRAAAKAALGQAFERDYTANFRQADVIRLYTLGLASHGKHLALASVVQSLPDGAPSKISFHQGSPKPKPATKKEPNEAARGVDPNVALGLQLLQQRCGLPVTPLEVLMGFTADELEAEAEHLSAGREAKIALIAQIQVVQSLCGLPVIPKERLWEQDLAILQGMAFALDGVEAEQRSPKKPSARSKAKPAPPPDHETQLQKAALAGQIQVLQELKGQTVADMDELLQLDQAALAMFVKMLKS